MQWTDIRRHYPDQWLLVVALLARSNSGKRQLDELAVVDTFPDGESALRAYLRLHRQVPTWELYVIHSELEELEITERVWLAPVGHRTSKPVAQVTSISKQGFCLLLDREELLIPFTEFPWFKSATIGQILAVERPSPQHLYWPELDIDLSVESIRNPAAFPLVSRSSCEH